MAPPTTLGQVPAIQAPLSNQVSQASQSAHGHALMMNVKQAQNSNDVVNDVFLVNDHFVSMLFDTGADKSFISLDFAYNDKPRNKLSKPYIVKVANGNSIIIDLVIRNCVLTLNKVKFYIYLIPL